MKLKMLSRLSLLPALCLTLSLGSAGSWAEQEEFSKANQLLFMQDHFDPAASARYTYQVVQTGPEAGSPNTITMTARDVAGNGTKSVDFSMSQKDLAAQLEPIERARGNPLIMIFLQTDVVDQAKATGGHWRYFQKQIKLALEHNATVEPVSVEFQGHKVPGQRIVLKPYVDEKDHRQELGAYLDKTYEFTLSEHVPGTVVELKTQVPPADGAGEPLTRQLTLEQVEEFNPS